MSKDEKYRIYEKLFEAFEEDKEKGEKTLIETLRYHYKIPKNEKVSEFLTKNISYSEVFVKIVNYLTPFSQMLNEIYSFLDKHRSSIFGKADQFAFNFEDLDKQIPFGLDSFPKTYINIMNKRLVETFSFNPEATGRLLDDIPNYWADHISALQNLGSHISASNLINILQDAPGYDEAERFVNNNRRIFEEVVEMSKTIISYCKEFLISDRLPIESEHYRHRGFISDSEDLINYFYYIHEEDRVLWRTIISNYNSKKIDNFAVLKIENELRTELRRFDLTKLHKLVEVWEKYPLRVQRRDKRKLEYSKEPRIPNIDDLSRYIDGFKIAFEMVFPKKIEDILVLEGIINKVILPFWHQRSRLYEVWAIVMIMQQFPEETTLQLFLKKRTDNSDAYEWMIPNQKASHPVGIFDMNRKQLQIWFERQTKTLSGNAIITPDIRIMTSQKNDIFILELKDRYKYPIEDAKGVLKKYFSGSHAKSVCIANYSPFINDDFKDDLMILYEGSIKLYIVNEFKPGKINTEVISSIKKLINEFYYTYDLIFDTSGSVEGIDINNQIEFIINRNGIPNQIFSFSDSLIRIEDNINKLDLKSSGGGTNLQKTLEEYMKQKEFNILEVLIVTDEDGIEQFTQFSSYYNFPKIKLFYGDMEKMENLLISIKYIRIT